MDKTQSINRREDELSIRDLLKLEQGSGSLSIDQFQYLRHIYKQMPVGVMMNLFCSVLVVWLFQAQVPQYLLFPWLVFIALTSGLHLLLINEFNKSKTHIGTSSNWSIYNTFLCMLVALAWGIGSLIFFPLISLELKFMFLGVTVLFTVTYLPVLSALYSSYILFISIISITFLLSFNFQTFENSFAASLILICTYIFLALISAYYNRSLLSSFKLATDLKENFHYLYELNELIHNDNIHLKNRITENRQHQLRLELEKEQAEGTLQSIGEGVITTDTEGYITYINPVAEILTGWELEDACGIYISDLFEIMEESGDEESEDPVRTCLAINDKVSSNEHTALVRKDKVKCFVEYSVTPIRNNKGIVTGTVLVFRDVTDKRNVAKDLVWKASHDPLTGLINRREFENRLIKILNSTKTPDRQHALCYIDLDQFKIVNDSCGHLAGDALLEKIARKLRSNTRDTDTLARLGGDEFGVILYSCSLEKARLIADSFRKKIDEIDFIWQDKHFKVGTSIGIVPITGETEDISEVLQLADMACYMAKDAGRNQIHIYHKDDHDIKQRKGEMRWIEEIQDALERENFVLYVQNIQPADESNPSSICEILLRMKKEDADDIPAARFLKTAKRYYLMPKIDRWTIKAVFELLSYGHPVLVKKDFVSINISTQSVSDSRTIGYILDMAKEYNINTNKVCFEIEESSLLNNPPAIDRFISDLSENGFRFALDNFSYSLNTLNQVHNLNLDYIKIDGSMSDAPLNRKIDKTALESINKLCHLMGIKTVAMFADDERNLKSLQETGIDYIQGYIISMPTALAKTA